MSFTLSDGRVVRPIWIVVGAVLITAALGGLVTDERYQSVVFCAGLVPLGLIGPYLAVDLLTFYQAQKARREARPTVQPATDAPVETDPEPPAAAEDVAHHRLLTTVRAVLSAAREVNGYGSNTIPRYHHLAPWNITRPDWTEATDALAERGYVVKHKGESTTLTWGGTLARLYALMSRPDATLYPPALDEWPSVMQFGNGERVEQSERWSGGVNAQE